MIIRNLAGFLLYVDPPSIAYSIDPQGPKMAACTPTITSTFQQEAEIRETGKKGYVSSVLLPLKEYS